jgi:hypothetical protein
MPKYYGLGTIFNVCYKHDGVMEEQQCILSNTYEEDFLFQVVVIKGYHAGQIDGFIEYQFPKNDHKKRNFCTLRHLRRQLINRVYSNITVLDIVSPSSP